jgi:Winged helix DNA-binding domain
MVRIDVAQRRARLGVRHALAVREDRTPVEVARAVVALHATDPATVFLALRARSASLDVAAIEHALYADRSLVRMLGMRRTMFVLPLEEAAVVHAAASRAVAAEARRRYVKLLTDAGIAGGGALLSELEDAAEAALLVRGVATGAEISADVPKMRTTLSVPGGETNVSPWVMLLLAADGRIARGRPRGGWTSTQWRWSPMRAWLPDGLAELATDEARVELLRLWLGAFGPGTVADLRWWTGWTAAQVKQALAPLKPVEVALDDGPTGLVLPSDVDPVPAPDPWVALLPALDPTPMGWSQRDWFLGPHRTALFDRNGNVGPTVWVDGRVVGGWAQRASGEVVYRLLEDVGREAADRVAETAAAIGDWTAAVRVTPRFRTPLEKELTSG